MKPELKQEHSSVLIDELKQSLDSHSKQDGKVEINEAIKILTSYQNNILKESDNPIIINIININKKKKVKLSIKHLVIAALEILYNILME